MKIITLAGLLLLTAASANAQWDFEFSYNNPSDANASSHVLLNEGIVVWNAGSDNQWLGVIPGAGAGRLTQRFTFQEAITSARLYTHITVSNFQGFGGSIVAGSGSIWGSTDNANWMLLLDAPNIPQSTTDYVYDDYLPPELLGAESVYFQTRLFPPVGVSSFARFSDASLPFQTPVFAFRASVPEPGTVAMLAAGGAFLLLRRRK